MPTFASVVGGVWRMHWPEDPTVCKTADGEAFLKPSMFLSLVVIRLPFRIATDDMIWCIDDLHLVMAEFWNRLTVYFRWKWPARRTLKFPEVKLAQDRFPGFLETWSSYSFVSCIPSRSL